MVHQVWLQLGLGETVLLLNVKWYVVEILQTLYELSVGNLNQ